MKNVVPSEKPFAWLYEGHVASKRTGSRMLCSVICAALCALFAPAAYSDGLLLRGDADTRVTMLEDRVVYTFLRNTKVKVVGSGTAEVLIVGGGGGSASSWWNQYLGGGGGGGVYHNTSFDLASGEYDVVVGAGGAAVGMASNAAQPESNNGGDSSAFGITVKGGGGGGRTNGGKGKSGGCGGGSSHAWVDGGVDGPVLEGGTSVYADSEDPHYHGFGGGSATVSWKSPGGGGAGGPGGDSHNALDGRGGIGYLCTITGREVYYGTGGNGSDTKTLPCPGGAFPGAPGVDGLGGGAGGAYGSFEGTAGGSGVVIVSVPRPAEALADSEDFLLEGGDETVYLKDGTAQVFRNDGTLTVTGSGSVELLIVGGGGSGGCPEYGLAGGGGGGGAVYHVTGLPVEPGTYPIVVGAGGAEIPAESGPASGNNGGDSSAFGIVAKGGGGGAGSNGAKPRDGGCGGGATVLWGSTDVRSGGKTVYATTDYGYHGFGGGSSCQHAHSGGGGGAGGPAADATESVKGRGGDGYACAITGHTMFYGAGGAGGRSAPESLGGAAMGQAGTDGLGAGGGAGDIATQGDNGGVGPAGGKGVVIVKYRRTAGLAKVVKAEEVTGGDRYCHGNGTAVRTFTQDGTLHVARRMFVDILLVGGGGGGGGRYDTQLGGGGGAGGVVTGTVVLAAGDYPIKVGAGGVHGAFAHASDLQGANGGDTRAFGYLAYGGGGGAGALGFGVPGNGASGGGGAVNTWSDDPKPVSPGKALYADYDVIGHDGGQCYVNGIQTASRRSGGGGGAGGPGGDATAGNPGAGGLGLSVEMFPGEPVTYAAGGKAVAEALPDSGTHPAPDNTGNGGDAFEDGGSGVVVIRYQIERNGTTVFVR